LIQDAWNDDTKQFRNFMDYRRNWLEDKGSEDSCARTIWALGATAEEASSAGLRRWAFAMFERTAKSVTSFGSPRAKAFAVLGACHILAVSPEHVLAKRVVDEGAEELMRLLSEARRPDWTWFEMMLGYDNCRLPEALLCASIVTNKREHADCGLETLKWIMSKQVAPSGLFRPVGSDSFGREQQDPLPFDQQPVEAWAAIDAARAAYSMSGDRVWLEHAKRAYAWFFGGNDRGISIADVTTGTCRDGITARGVNENEGAESVLALHFAQSGMRRLDKCVADKVSKERSDIVA
jgi:hypothetical protein